MSTYLQHLTIQLAMGAAHLTEAERSLHAQFIWGYQQPDGGFAGREGGSDLYYTGFALRSLSILGELDGSQTSMRPSFCGNACKAEKNIIDFLSLLYGGFLIEAAAPIRVFPAPDSGWQSAVAQFFEQLRRDDGGYAKGPDGRASSTYHSFLVILCLQLLEQPIPEPERLVKFLMSQQAEGGGFREIRAGNGRAPIQPPPPSGLSKS